MLRLIRFISEEVEGFLIFVRNVLTAASLGQCTLMLSQAAGIKAVKDLEMFRLIPSFILGIIKQDAERRAKKTSNRWQKKERTSC